MRKKIYNILILPAALAALFWTSSCNGFLNVVPDDGLPNSSPDEEKFGFSYEVLDNYIRFGKCENEEIKEK